MCAKGINSKLGRYMHAHHVPHAEHVESSIGQKYYGEVRNEVETTLSSAYPVHGSASETDHSDVDVQVISYHCCLVVFHIFVE